MGGKYWEQLRIGVPRNNLISNRDWTVFKLQLFLRFKTKARDPFFKKLALDFLTREIAFKNIGELITPFSLLDPSDFKYSSTCQV